MAELNAVVGTILRELAQARYMSDSYSRFLSKLYEKDVLMRMFPVPRAEIQEVEICLKFAIAKIERIQQNKEDTLSKIYASRIDGIAQDAMQGLKGSKNFQKDYPEWLKIVEDLRKQNIKTEIISMVLNALETKSSEFIKGMDSEQEDDKDSTRSDNGEDSKTAFITLTINRENLRKTVNQAIYDVIFKYSDVEKFIEKAEAKQTVESKGDKRKTSIKGRIKSSIAWNITDRIYVLEGELESIELEEFFALNIDATSDVLENLPDTAITSLRIKTQIRNYLWSQVEDSESGSVYKLSPE